MIFVWDWQQKGVQSVLIVAVRHIMTEQDDKQRAPACRQTDIRTVEGKQDITD